MIQRWYIRMALAAVIGLGVAAGLARSQEVVPPPARTVDSWSVNEFGGGASLHPMPQLEAPPEWPKKGPVRDWIHDCLHKQGFCCWSHHNAYTCGSVKSELVFIFGPCKEFFGEPCLPGPPQPPYPLGYGPPPYQYGNGNGNRNGNSAQRNSGCPGCQ